MSDALSPAENDVPVVGCPMCRERGSRCSRHPAENGAPYPTDLYPGCPCVECMREWSTFTRMALCPTCGSKRCPGASDHDNHVIPPGERDQ